MCDRPEFYYRGSIATSLHWNSFVAAVRDQEEPLSAASLIHDEKTAAYIQYIHDQGACEGLILRALQHGGTRYFNHVKERDEATCIEALRRNPLVLQYIEDQTEEMCLIAVERDWRAIYVAQHQTPAICRAAVAQSPSALAMIVDQTDELVLACLARHHSAFAFIHHPSNNLFRAILSEPYWSQLPWSTKQRLNFLLYLARLGYSHVYDALSDKALEAQGRMAFASQRGKGTNIWDTSNQSAHFLTLGKTYYQSRDFALVRDQKPSLSEHFIAVRAGAFKYVRSQTPELCQLAVKLDPNNIIYVKNRTRELCELAVQKDPKTIEWIWTHNDAVALSAVKRNPLMLRYVRHQTLEMMEWITPDALPFVSKECRDVAYQRMFARCQLREQHVPFLTREVKLSVIALCPQKFVSFRSTDESFHLEALRQTPAVYAYFSPKNKDKYKRAAIDANAYNFHQIPNPTYQDLEYAVRRSGLVLKGVAYSQLCEIVDSECEKTGLSRRDQLLNLNYEAVCQNGAALNMTYANGKICLKALETAPEYYRFWIAGSAYDTEEMALVAARGLASNVIYIRKHMMTEDLLLKIVAENGLALEYVPVLKRSPRVCLEAVLSDPLALQWVKSPTARMCYMAARYSEEALAYVPEEHKEEVLRRIAGDMVSLAYDISQGCAPVPDL